MNSEKNLIGTGFSTTACENEVFIGGVSCLITSVSSTQICCKIGKNSGLQANTMYGVEVLVKNKGFALHNDFFQINFISVVSSISLYQG